MAGLLLIGFAAGTFLLTNLALALLEDGKREAVDYASTLGGGGASQQLALAGLDRLANWLVGGVQDAAERFRLLVVLAFAAGVLAVMTAVRGKPDRIWPELTWGASAALALVPAFALQLWLVFAGFPAILVATAAVLHFTRRHDLTVARGTEVARQAAAVVKPHGEDAAKRGKEAATVARTKTTQAAAATRERLPAARENAFELGRRGRRLAARSAPKARGPVGALRRRRRSD